MAEQNVLYSKEDGIGIITINRPERMNAVTDDMLTEIFRMVADTIRDDEVRGVIITGSGRAFCGGTDVSALGRSEQESAAARQRRAEAMQGAVSPESPLSRWLFARIPKPTIAAINGPAVGMGAEWTAECDIRIASENARIGWVFSLRGLTPDTGAGPYLLPYIVGPSRALELMYSGEVIDAHEAERIGLVSKVVPLEQLMPTAKEMAKKLTRGAPLALKGIKELTYGALEWPPSVHAKETAERFLRMSQTEDCKEGVRSFIEKRPPVWKGR